MENFSNLKYINKYSRDIQIMDLTSASENHIENFQIKNRKKKSVGFGIFSI